MTALLVTRKVTTMRLSLVMVVAGLALARAQDKCPRPDEIAPCQCRTRGPSIQVR